MSSNILLFRSLQRHQIKHNGAKFQMLDKCFPSQFHQPKRVSTTDLGKIQENPKDLSTKVHNRQAFPQCSNKWSTVSPLLRHMIHQSTKSNLLPLKLSPIRILSHTAVHTKKETRRGALTFQTPFQGKIMGKGFLTYCRTIEYQSPHSLSTSIAYDLRSQWEVDLSPRYRENHPHHPFPNHLVSE